MYVNSFIDEFQQVPYFVKTKLKKNNYVWIIDQVWGQDGWILAKFFFCVFMDRDGVHVAFGELFFAGHDG